MPVPKRYEAAEARQLRLAINKVLRLIRRRSAVTRRTAYLVEIGTISVFEQTGRMVCLDVTSVGRNQPGEKTFATRIIYYPSRPVFPVRSRRQLKSSQKNTQSETVQKNF